MVLIADLEHLSSIFPSQSLMKQRAVSRTEAYLKLICSVLCFPFLNPHLPFQFSVHVRSCPGSAVVGAPVPNLTCSLFSLCWYVVPDHLAGRYGDRFSYFLCFIIDASKYFYVQYELGEDQSWRLELSLLLSFPYVKFTHLCIKQSCFLILLQSCLSLQRCFHLWI